MKKLFAFLMFLFVLAAGALMILPRFITPETIKAQLIEQVEKATGRTLKIEGKLEVAGFPNLGVVAEDVSLSNPPGFGGDTFVSLKRMQLGVALMPLLSKQIELTEFVLVDPVVSLHMNKAGKANWDFSAPKQAEEKTDAKQAEAAPAKGGDNPMAALKLSNIEIQNGKLTYADDTTGNKQALEQLNLVVSAASLSSPLSAKGDTLWQGKKLAVTAQVNTMESLMAGKAAFDAGLSSDALSFSAKGELDGESVKAKVDANSSSLKALMSWLNPKAKPMAVPTPLAFEFSTNASCKGKVCSFADLSVGLDHLKGKGKADANLSGGKPALDVELAMNELDLAPFMAQPAKTGALSLIISEAYAQGAPWSKDAIDLSGLKAADVNAAITTPGIKVGKFTIGETPVKAQMKGGKLNVVVAGAKLYGGVGNVNLTADGNGAPQVSIKGDVRDVQIEPLMKDAMDMDRISGTSLMRFDLNARGGSQAEMVSSLGGGGEFAVTDGQIKRVNLLELVNNISGKLAGGQSSGATAFSKMNGTFTFNGGVMSCNDLILEMPGTQVTGAGNVNLPAYTIDYKLSPRTVGQVKQADGTTKTREGLSVPVLITGSLDSPSFKPDAASLIKQAISDPKAMREQIKNNTKNLKEQIQQPKEAVKNIKNLLKGF